MVSDVILLEGPRPREINRTWNMHEATRGEGLSLRSIEIVTWRRCPAVYARIAACPQARRSRNSRRRYGWSCATLLSAETLESITRYSAVPPRYKERAAAGSNQQGSEGGGVVERIRHDARRLHRTIREGRDADTVENWLRRRAHASSRILITHHVS